MTLNEYQKKALETAQYRREYNIIYPTLGLTGEAGEVSDKVKKVLRDHNGDFSESIKCELAKELGDVLWYIATLSHDLGYTLEKNRRNELYQISFPETKGCDWRKWR